MKDFIQKAFPAAFLLAGIAVDARVFPRNLAAEAFPNVLSGYSSPGLEILQPVSPYVFVPSSRQFKTVQKFNIGKSSKSFVPPR
jgi:hypothetical protein